jgi:predicted membrane-bound spermidine synthase
MASTVFFISLGLFISAFVFAVINTVDAVTNNHRTLRNVFISQAFAVVALAITGLSIIISGIVCLAELIKA